MSETHTARLGQVSTDGDVVVLRYERELAHPPERVWRVLTESEHLRHWFPADIVGDRVAGAALRLPFWPEAIAQAGEEIQQAGLDLDAAELSGELITWDPPRRFEFTWDTEHLRFDLRPIEAGTRLLVTICVVQSGPRGYQSTAAGYHVCLDALVATADGVAVDLFDDARTQALEAAYADLVTASTI